MRYCGIFLVLASAGALLAADIRVVDEIVVKVNGDIVTRSELESSRKQMEAEIRRGLKGTEMQQALQEMEKNILRDRIDTLLLIQKGKELNINVDPDVNKQIADIQRQSKIADPEKFQQFVREQTGMPYEDYKNDMKNGILTRRVIQQEVSSRINVKREELEKYYNEHKDEFNRKERVFLREILVSTEGKDAAGIAAAEKKAKDLVARARKGEKFPEMARDNSDAATAPQGGDLGQAFEKSQLRPELNAAVWDKERGYVTDPIRIENGFEILKVEEHQKEGLASLDEVENEIMDKLFTPRMDPEIRKYLTKLRQDAFLEIKPGYTDSGAAAGKDTTWTDPAQLKPQTVTKAEVASQIRMKRLLWLVPIPGTETEKSKSSSSR